MQGYGCFVVLSINPKVYNVTLNSVKNYTNQGTMKDITLSRCGIGNEGFRYKISIPWDEIGLGDLDGVLYSGVQLNITITKK